VSVPVFSLVVRKDVFDEVAGGIPNTWDELRDALRAIKEEYPDSTPLADGFETQSMLNYAAHGFGTIAGWGFGVGTIDGEGDELIYAAATDECKALGEYFRSLVEEGLLDRESLTESNVATGASDVSENLAKYLCFAAYGSSATAIVVAQGLAVTAGQGNFEFALLPPPAGPAGVSVELRNFWHGFMLG